MKLIGSFVMTLKGFFSHLRSFLTPEKRAFPTKAFPPIPGLIGMILNSEGEEKCTACKICEAFCPAQAIIIDVEEGEKGIPKAGRFDIDMTKCIACGLCVEACPVDALREVPSVFVGTTSLSDLYFGKEKLLKIGQGEFGEDFLHPSLKEKGRLS